MIDLEKYFEIADKANNLASNFLINSFGGTKEMFFKERDNQYGIEDDKLSNEIYESYLKKESPEVALYTEEGQRNLDNELVWVIDPIEGTSNYRTGNPFFATQIALLYKKEPVIAIVNAPILKQKFTAKKNEGAFLNGKAISITDLSDLTKAVLDMGRGGEDNDKDWFVDFLGIINKKVRTFRSYGACGLDMSYAAAGITDIYINSGSKLYDYLPGTLIVREAGGKVLNFKGEDWSISDKDLLASNTVLTKGIIDLL